MTHSAWPLFDLRIRCRTVTLRPVKESDLSLLAAIQPDDYEHNPHAERLPGTDLRQHRQRLVHQDYWRALGTWSPSSWTLSLAVEYSGALVGVQSLEAENFMVLRTVDSGSWLIHAARGRGVGVAMRKAVLGLAFDHLDALAAVSAARRDNGASLGVSHSLGYTNNGVSLNNSGTGLVELQHMRLPVQQWRAAGHGSEIAVDGLTPCLAWFGR
ncbi:GNAT family N-acetyltransferase [Actinoplanes sp. TFC3]|uniref:GNAT family N-acetyltransferase n=1 Tax=Actinoplanes sp. TFC3 TaxID=1710355 RepID=UPI0008349068|nr:GNAT family N-acetyltransferase [Actinoplanes sp. TFC3]